MQITHGGSALTFKAGFSKEKLPQLTITRVDEGSFTFTFTFTSTKDLEPGEYLITFGLGWASGFDFGVVRKP